MTHYADGDLETRITKLTQKQCLETTSRLSHLSRVEKRQFPEVWEGVRREPRRGPEPGQRRSVGSQCFSFWNPGKIQADTLLLGYLCPNEERSQELGPRLAHLWWPQPRKPSKDSRVVA